MTPLHGTKTRPLTHHAKNKLKEICRIPLPEQEINPGLRHRFFRESLVEYVMLPSPYKKHKGTNIRFLQITDAGRNVLSS